MVDKDQQEKEKISEKDIVAQEQRENFRQETEKMYEKREVSPDDKRVSDELRQEIEKMELDDIAKKEAEKKAEKIEHLLKIAREKGVVFAIQVVKRMNEPYLLDILHDTLAQEGFYKKIGQSADDNNDDDNKN